MGGGGVFSIFGSDSHGGVDGGLDEQIAGKMLKSRKGGLMFTRMKMVSGDGLAWDARVYITIARHK